MRRQAVGMKVRNGYQRQYKVFVAHQDEDLENGLLHFSLSIWLIFLVYYTSCDLIMSRREIIFSRTLWF